MESTHQYLHIPNYYQWLNPDWSKEEIELKDDHGKTFTRDGTIESKTAFFESVACVCACLRPDKTKVEPLVDICWLYNGVFRSRNVVTPQNLCKTPFSQYFVDLEKRLKLEIVPYKD